MHQFTSVVFNITAIRGSICIVLYVERKTLYRIPFIGSESFRTPVRQSTFSPAGDASDRPVA